MSAEIEINDTLNAHAGLVAEVADRIYPDFLAQEISLPAVVYQRADTGYVVTIHSSVVVGLHVTMDLFCLAKTRLEAEKVADLVELALASSNFRPTDRTLDFDDQTLTYTTIVRCAGWPEDITATVSSGEVSVGGGAAGGDTGGDTGGGMSGGSTPDGGPRVTLTWNASSTPQGVAAGSYRLYIGTTNGHWTRTIDVGSVTTYTIADGLSEGTLYYWIVTALNASGDESWASGVQEFWCPTQARTFHVAKTGSDSNPGTVAQPWLTITKAHNTATSPGDTIIVHAGTYDESLIIRHGGSSHNARITYQAAYGEHVTLTYSGTVPQYLGVYYAVGSGQTNYSGEGAKSYVCFDGFNVQYDKTKSDRAFFYVTKGGNNNGANWTFKNINGSNCDKAIFCEDVTGTRIWDCTLHGNAQSGMWIFGEAGVSLNTELRRVTAYSNNPNTVANCDGITIQDAEYILLEDCHTYGVNPGVAPPTNTGYQYDGTDIGSQDGPGDQGMKYAILRRILSHDNSNTNFPNSSTHTGPVVFEYCTHYSNYNWGSSSTYFGSKNVEFWNCTADDVGQAYHFEGSGYSGFASSYSMAVYNSITNLRHAADSVFHNTDVGHIRHDYNHKSTLGSWTKGSGPADPVTANETTGNAGFADASFGTSHDYRLSATSVCRGSGATFMTTTAAGTSTTAVPVSKDPRAYFWPGDQVQVGAGASAPKAFIASMTSSSITLFTPITFASGAGVHLPFDGSAPDKGSQQYTTRCERVTGLRVTDVVFA